MLVTTKERLIKFLESNSISKVDFYKELGIKRGLLDTDKLKASITDVILAKILVVYPNLNIKWLLTGEGNMLNNNTCLQYARGDNNQQLYGSGKIINEPMETYRHDKKIIELEKTIQDLLKKQEKLYDRIEKLTDKLLS